MWSSLVIDAVEGVTEQDAKIAGIAHERGKGIIIAVNKWDAVEKDDKTIYEYTEKVRSTLSFMPYAEILFISAETGQRLPKLFETIDMVLENQTHAYPDRCAQRDHDRSGCHAAATVRQGKTAENFTI